MAEKQNIKLRCPKCGKKHKMPKDEYQTLETKELRCTWESMIVHKIINGFVTQRFDTETGEWVDQEFTAGDESHETAYGETEILGEDVEDLFPDKDLPLVMVQPSKDK